MPFKIILRIKKLNVYIDHFLLFSETPESTFNKFIDNYNLIELVPYSNFGFFKSGMLWMKNSSLEILNYPKNIPAPNSNQFKNRFVGIALTTDLSPENTLKLIKKNEINSSEILDEEVIDKSGNKVTIAKVILLNDYFHDFRVFFIFYTSDYIGKKEKELSDKDCSIFHKCEISVNNSKKIIDLFFKLGLEQTDKKSFLTKRYQELQIIDSEDLSTEIISLEIKINNNKIDIVSELSTMF